MSRSTVSLPTESATPQMKPNQLVYGEFNMTEPYDLICVGFGPASLAIAVALHDLSINSKVLFLERQHGFAWHSGMLLPNARMQISFMKDLATFRDPRSRFTFLNYLKEQDRLAHFSNLGTFYPLREEFNDYLAWVARHFARNVRYGSETISISPVANRKKPVELWNVLSRDTESNETFSYRAKNVVIAVGGRPRLPPALQGPSLESIVIHSSQYLRAISRIPLGATERTHIAVIGSGQSAAEIFEDLMSRYPQAHTTLFTASSALKPSDDSPFVNEIFDPGKVDEFYSLPLDERRAAIADGRATNYSVVRPELVDRLYERMYHQRLRDPDKHHWQHQIINLRHVVGTARTVDDKVSLKLRNPRTGRTEFAKNGFDLVICGTGYVRNVHEQMLEPAKNLLEDSSSSIERNYRLRFKKDAVSKSSGVWLQGCSEESHGLSDTLLSILAVRGGELVNSIFGETTGEKDQGTNQSESTSGNVRAML